MSEKNIEKKRNMRLIKAFVGKQTVVYSSYISHQIFMAFKDYLVTEKATNGDAFEYLIFSHLENMEGRGDLIDHPKLRHLYHQWEKAKHQLLTLNNMDVRGKSHNDKLRYIFNLDGVV